MSSSTTTTTTRMASEKKGITEEKEKVVVITNPQQRQHLRRLTRNPLFELMRNHLPSDVNLELSPSPPPRKLKRKRQKKEEPISSKRSHPSGSTLALQSRPVKSSLVPLAKSRSLLPPIKTAFTQKHHPSLHNLPITILARYSITQEFWDRQNNQTDPETSSLGSGTYGEVFSLPVRIDNLETQGKLELVKVAGHGVQRLPFHHFCANQKVSLSCAVKRFRSLGSTASHASGSTSSLKINLSEILLTLICGELESYALSPHFLSVWSFNRSPGPSREVSLVQRECHLDARKLLCRDFQHLADAGIRDRLTQMMDQDSDAIWRQLILQGLMIILAFGFYDLIHNDFFLRNLLITLPSPDHSFRPFPLHYDLLTSEHSTVTSAHSNSCRYFQSWTKVAGDFLHLRLNSPFLLSVCDFSISSLNRKDLQSRLRSLWSTTLSSPSPPSSSSSSSLSAAENEAPASSPSPPSHHDSSSDTVFAVSADRIFRDWHVLDHSKVPSIIDPCSFSSSQSSTTTVETLPAVNSLREALPYLESGNWIPAHFVALRPYVRDLISFLLNLKRYHGRHSFPKQEATSQWINEAIELVIKTHDESSEAEAFSTGFKLYYFVVHHLLLPHCVSPNSLFHSFYFATSQESLIDFTHQSSRHRYRLLPPFHPLWNDLLRIISSRIPCLSSTGSSLSPATFNLVTLIRNLLHGWSVDLFYLSSFTFTPTPTPSSSSSKTSLPGKTVKTDQPEKRKE